MICDVNIAWKDFSVGERACLAIEHVAQGFVHVAKTIIDLVRVLFSALAWALTFNKSEVFQAQFKGALISLISNVANVGLSGLGFFAPINAVEWKLKTTRNITEFFIPSAVTKPFRMGFAIQEL